MSDIEDYAIRLAYTAHSTDEVRSEEKSLWDSMKSQERAFYLNMAKVRTPGELVLTMPTLQIKVTLEEADKFVRRLEACGFEVHFDEDRRHCHFKRHGVTDVCYAVAYCEEDAFVSVRPH